MARLRHVDCAEPGLTRRRYGRGFAYLDEEGRPVRDEAVIDRIRSLAIPPAWRDVWICVAENGHLQAVGTDDAGRRQYLYHPRWRLHRDREKFEGMLDFARSLPAMRRRTEKLLAGEGLSRERVLACAVSLLDRGLFRIGGEEYAEANGSYGLSTLERRHVEANGSGTLRFDFEGKTGKRQTLEVHGRAIYDVGSELIRSRRRSTRFLVYRDGRRYVDVRAEDVNAFVKELVGSDFSAKDFRTWHATVLAAVAVAASDEPGTAAGRKRAVTHAVEDVSDALGNTPAVSRASYIDPRVFDRFRAGATIAGTLEQAAWQPGRPLTATRQAKVEAAVLDLLGEPT